MSSRQGRQQPCSKWGAGAARKKGFDWKAGDRQIVVVPAGAVASFYDDVGNKMKRADCVLQTRLLQLLPAESEHTLFLYSVSASCLLLLQFFAPWRPAPCHWTLKCRCNVWHTDQVQCNVQSSKKAQKSTVQNLLFSVINNDSVGFVVVAVALSSLFNLRQPACSLRRKCHLIFS